MNMVKKSTLNTGNRGAVKSIFNESHNQRARVVMCKIITQRPFNIVFVTTYLSFKLYIISNACGTKIKIVH